MPLTSLGGIGCHFSWSSFTLLLTMTLEGGDAGTAKKQLFRHFLEEQERPKNTLR